MQFHSKVFTSLFFMSRFDPFDLYSHRQKYSHEGQILRKKPVKTNYAISREMIKEAQRILTAVGMYNQIPTPSPQPVLRTYTNLLNSSYTGHGQLLTGDFSFKISNIFSDVSGIRSAFDNVLNAEGTLSSFHVTIILNSLSYFDSEVGAGSFTLKTPNLTSTQEFSTTYRSVGTWLPASSNSYIFQAANYINEYYYTNVDNGLLSRVTSQTTEAYNALKNVDFTNWNPELFSVTVTPHSGFEIFSYSFTINMVANYT